MPSLRDLALKRNERLDQLRIRFNQSSVTDKGGSSNLSESVNDSATVRLSDSCNTLEQETIDGEHNKVQQQSSDLKKNKQQPNTDRICETSDLKAKLAPAIEVLEKKTNEKIKGIVNRRILQEASYESDSSH
ncbi:hypothetical protein SMKI_02G2980 [Saccharomyces mikatae IFO 1815]|uniref:Uncharacterized protein n=1 Tax=Saccharomyces mikatae IFO 1815 TaxID=226126 RepID=A0AA35IUY6_SACMI|nr:uncharacterized protein SMKI_02G2980 [Saccharomyces mikatae IFO 1815]CAI4037423.1 hypothetical protein SMKI_02G2980 [Saccharomyces mikatae IFO 1815]